MDTNDTKEERTTELSNEEQGQNQGADTRVFTQEQVDEMIKARLARVKGNPSKTGDIEEIKQKAEMAEQKLLTYERRDKILKKGVPAKLADFILFEASKMVSDEDDFDGALEQFLEQNQEYLSPQNQAWSMGMRQGSAQSRLSGVELAFAKRNPNLKIE